MRIAFGERSHSGALELLTDLSACLLAALLWARSLLPDFADLLRDGYDAGLMCWQLAWVRHALTTGAGLFQANALAPMRDALATTEPLIGYGLASLPFAPLGPVAAYNIACLLGVALTPFCLALLARQLGVPRLPALLGGLAVAFGALTALQLGHVTFSFSGGIALVLAAWVAYRRRGGRLALALFALAVAVVGWCSLQLLTFALTGLGALVLADAVRNIRRMRQTRLAGTLAGLAIAAALLAPLLVTLQSVRQREGFVRTRSEVATFSAAPRDYLITTTANPGQAFLAVKSDWERALYPGTVALLLALVALIPPYRDRGPAIAAGVLLTAVGYLASLGYATPLYPLLAKAAPPLFAGIRAVVRFAFLCRTGLALLAAAGAWRLLGRRPLPRAALGAVLLAAMAFDQRQTLRFAHRVEIPYPPIEDFLARAGVGGPVLHLPLTFRTSEARNLLASMAHFGPIVNATSSFLPQRFTDLAGALVEDPVPASVLDTMRRWPVAAVVLHEHELPADWRRRTLRFLQDSVSAGELSAPLLFGHGDGYDVLFGVAGVRGARPWGTRGGMPLRVLARAAEDALPPGLEADMPCSIDAPEEAALIRGPLQVVGWAQAKGEAIDIEEARVDGDRRALETHDRVPRPDVGAVLPDLGDVSRAGYRLVIRPVPGDTGPHVLRLRFRSRSGGVRTLERRFLWQP